MAIMDMGRKAIKLKPCAEIWFMERNMVKSGISKVPPPIPIPPNTPPSIPNTISKNICI